MPYFHATAVFEARGASLEETDQRAATLFRTLRNPRVRYYEHDTSGGVGPYPQSKALYFTVIADFDVESQSEERASDVVDEVLDALSPDDMQYLAHGLAPGEQRVNVEQQAPREEQREPERKNRSQRDGQEERKDRKRGSRGRGRNRDADRRTQVSPEQESRTVPPSRHEESTITSVSSEAAAPSEELAKTTRPAQPILEDTIETRELSLSPSSSALETMELSQQPPPPRSSSQMRVTLTVKLHASELALPMNEPMSPDHPELAALAIIEARRRHPELPADITPELEVESQRGNTILMLTWHYDVPVPSAADAA